MNGKELQDATVLAVQEPQAHRVRERLLITPMSYSRWTMMVPSAWREGRWPIRSTLWVNKEVDAEQIRIDSPDLTAVAIGAPERRILVVSVYVEGLDTQALRKACTNLRKVIHEVRSNAETVVEVILAGDFNRQDQLWGGDDLSPLRQDEADPINDLMNEFALSSLLPRGTRTWLGGGGHGGEHATTIDLVLASEEATNAALKCTIHKTEHGSDHRAIETVIDLAVLTEIQQEQRLAESHSL